MMRNSKTKWQKVHENNSQIRPKIGRILSRCVAFEIYKDI